MVNGVKVKVCTICNETKIDAPEGVTHIHKYKVISEIDSTCQEEGLRTKECQNPGCDERIVEEKIAKKPHVSTTKAGEGYVITDATKCGTDGLELVYCTNIVDGKVCNERFERAISAHNYDEGVVATKATCTEKGTMKFTCKDCGATKFEDIDALGHDFGTTEEEPVTLVPATCQNTGLAEKVCKRCRYEDKVTLQALGHDLDTVNGKATIAATVYLEKGKVVTTDGKAYNGKTDNTSNAKPVPAGETSNCKYDIAQIIVCGNGALCNEKDGKVMNITKKATGHVAKTGTETRIGIATIDMDDVIVDGVYNYSNYGYVTDEENGEIVFEKGAVVDCCHEKVKIIDCKYCDDGIVVVEARKAHNGNVKQIPASCTDYGYTQTSCRTCNKVVVEKTTEKPTGHNYSFVKETCTEDAHVKCTKCTLKLDETALGNVTDAKEVKELKSVLVKAGIITSAQGLNDVTFENATGHKFVGNVVLDANDTTKGSIYCANKGCRGLTTVKVAIAAKAEEGTITVLDAQGVATQETYPIVVTYTDANKTTIKAITLKGEGSGEENPPAPVAHVHDFTNSTLSVASPSDGDTVIVKCTGTTGTCSENDKNVSLTFHDNGTVKTITDGTNTWTITVDSSDNKTITACTKN